MPITPKNNFKNILDKLKNILRTEFGNTLPIYVGHDTKNVSSQYLRLDPISNSLLEYASFSETREYNINFLYYSGKKDIEKVALDNVLRVVARIEALIHDNITMELSDSSKAYDCKIETTEYNTEEEEEKYVVTMSFNCKHLGNVA
tara:strand:- start:7659 stop:8096 length:438 start_codon:yes stop_codon:yes gene_type:complete